MPTSTHAAGIFVFTKPCGEIAIAPRADRGVRPYRTFCVCTDGVYNFAIASRTGGVEPRPYGSIGNAVKIFIVLSD